jgi:hypothetical protein
MARAANTYRAQRRAVGKTKHRENGAGVSANTPRLSNSPVANKMRGFPRNTGPAKYLGMAGNIPGSVRRAKRRSDLVRLTAMLYGKEKGMEAATRKPVIVVGGSARAAAALSKKARGA